MLTHKIRFYPTEQQEELLRQSCGVNRFAYNWALNKWNTDYLLNKKTGYSSVKKEFNAMKNSDEDKSWIKNVSKSITEYAISDLEQAFRRFFKKKARHPKFKKRKDGVGSFSIANDRFWIKGNILRIQKIGKVKLAEKLRYTGYIMKATVSHVNDKWFVSVTLRANKHKTSNKKIIGIDLGIKDTIITSNGDKIKIPELQREYKRVKIYQKRLSRKVKGSNNRWKAIKLLQNAWFKLYNKKKDWIDKVTSTLSKQYEYIALETLNIKGMMQNRHLSAKFQHISLYNIVEKLKTKAKVLQIDKWYPSSQLCHVCNYQNHSLTLKDREWVCPNCGAKHDRDENASKNILGKAIADFKLVDKKALTLIPCGLE